MMTEAKPHKSPDKNVLKALDDYQVTLAIMGDSRAFALLYKRWHPKLLRLSYRLTRNQDEAQDVMQEAAMTIAKNIGKLQDPSKFSAWAYTIVRRRAADHIARAVKSRKIKTQFSSLAPQNDTHRYAANVETVLSLKQALTQIPDQDRILLTLFYVDGMSGKEMAAAMGVPLGTIKSRLFAARTKLHNIYTTPKKET